MPTQMIRSLCNLVTSFFDTFHGNPTMIPVALQPLASLLEENIQITAHFLTNAILSEK